MNRKHLAALIIQISLTTYLAGCLPDGSQPLLSAEPAPESSTGAVSLTAKNATWAARSLAAEPGGEIVAEIRHAAKRTSFRDSIDWNGTSGANLRFGAIPEGAGYQATLFYRDARGLITHADTLRDLEVVRSRVTEASFQLRALLGRLQLVVPSAPVAVDSLSLSWTSGALRRTSRAARGPSGRTALRLDSLVVGSSGTLRIRAWNTSGDTLYFADSVCTILSQADQALQIRMLDARGQIAFTAQFQAGGELDAVALFPDDQAASGRLVIGAMSDSGSSDWIRIENRGADSAIGAVKIVRGTETFSVALRLGPGSDAIVSRATCAATASSSHPLHGAPTLVCDASSLSVSWSSTGTLWELRTSEGSLLDQFIAFDGQNGWPDLNATTSRTVRRAPSASALEASAGRSWCADGSDSPVATSCN